MNNQWGYGKGLSADGMGILINKIDYIMRFWSGGQGVLARQAQAKTDKARSHAEVDKHCGGVFQVGL